MRGCWHIFHFHFHLHLHLHLHVFISFVIFDVLYFSSRCFVVLVVVVIIFVFVFFWHLRRGRCRCRIRRCINTGAWIVVECRMYRVYRKTRCSIRVNINGPKHRDKRRDTYARQKSCRRQVEGSSQRPPIQLHAPLTRLIDKSEFYPISSEACANLSLAHQWLDCCSIANTIARVVLLKVQVVVVVVSRISGSIGFDSDK